MHVIFIEPAFPANQREFVRALRQAGALVSAIGDRPVDVLDDELKSWLYSYEHVPSTASEEHLISATRRIQKRGPWVHRLECVIEALMLPAAAAREATGIPGMTIDQTVLCRDKYKMKQFLRARGVPCARATEATNLEEAVGFAQQVGWPIILKPKAAAGAAGTWRCDDVHSLAAAVQESGMAPHRPMVLEEFILGHEGFYDTLTCNGEVVFEAISHYYPAVLPAMRDRSISPVVITTNRIDAPGYRELRQFGRRVVKELGLGTTASHMEWFYGPKGLFFSEIGARPPGVRVWDLYNAANDFDLYFEWAKAVVQGRSEPRPSRQFSAGMVSLRPNADGHIKGYSGVEEVNRRYGKHILKQFYPAPGTRTNPVGAGYLGHAYVWVKHPDYDTCRTILEDIGRLVTVWAG